MRSMILAALMAAFVLPAAAEGLGGDKYVGRVVIGTWGCRDAQSVFAMVDAEEKGGKKAFHEKRLELAGVGKCGPLPRLPSVMERLLYEYTDSNDMTAGVYQLRFQQLVYYGIVVFGKPAKETAI